MTDGCRLVAPYLYRELGVHFNCDARKAKMKIGQKLGWGLWGGGERDRNRGRKSSVYFLYPCSVPLINNNPEDMATFHIENSKLMVLSK